MHEILEMFRSDNEVIMYGPSRYCQRHESIGRRKQAG